MKGRGYVRHNKNTGNLRKLQAHKNFSYYPQQQCGALQNESLLLSLLSAAY